MRTWLTYALFLLPLSTTAGEISVEDSRQLKKLLVASTTSKTADLASLSCTWKTISPGTICAYRSYGPDHDSFMWHGNAVLRILRKYVEPVYRPDRVWHIEIRNLRCGEVCRFD